MKIKSNRGFTLIEVMIVVVIVAILASVAIPSYRDSVRKARRADAKTSLLNVQLAEERWRANNSTYSTSTTNLGVSATSGEGYYDISIAVNGGTGYTLTATAVSSKSQSSDTGCTTMILRGGDQITSTNPEKSPATCW